MPAEAHTLPLTANGFSHKMPDYPVRYIMLTLYLHALESTAAWSGTPITVRSQAPARDVLLHFRAPSSLITMMDMMDSSFLNGPLESYVAAEYAARTAASTAYMAFSAYSAAAISLIMMSCLLVLVAERAGDGPRSTTDDATHPGTSPARNYKVARLLTADTTFEEAQADDSQDAWQREESDDLDLSAPASSAPDEEEWWLEVVEASEVAAALDRRIGELRELREREASLRAALLEAVEIESFDTAAEIQEELSAFVRAHSYEQLDGPYTAHLDRLSLWTDLA